MFCEYHLRAIGTTRALDRFEAVLAHDIGQFDGVFAHHRLYAHASVREYVGTCAGTIRVFLDAKSPDPLDTWTLPRLARETSIRFELYGRNFTDGFEEHAIVTKGRRDIGRKNALFALRPDGLVEKISGGYDQWGVYG